MDNDEFWAVLERYPQFKAGLPHDLDEVLRISERIVRMENEPDLVPVLPADAPEWEKAYWARRAARKQS